MLLALTVLGGIIWHILPGKFIKLLFPIISIFIWLITTLYRLARIYRNRGAYVSSYHLVVKSGDQEFGVIKVNVQVPRHESFKPGKYLYLYFTNLGWQYRFQSHPFMITWCEDSKETVDGKEFDVTNLTFLIQPRSGLTARLCRELQLSELSYRKANSRNSILFDGPYGQNLQLERYETVMLVAKGIGIAGVLPYAGYLMQRNCRDAEIKKLLRLESTANKDELRNSLHRDATRKVDLFWELELNRQEEWVFDHLRTLQDQDPDRVSVHGVSHEVELTLHSVLIKK
jgi:predicted ferric reductase